MLGKSDDLPVSSAPEWKLSGPMWVDYSPRPMALGPSPPRSQSPSLAVTGTVSSQSATATQQLPSPASMGSGKESFLILIFIFACLVWWVMSMRKGPGSAQLIFCCYEMSRV